MEFNWGWIDSSDRAEEQTHGPLIPRNTTGDKHKTSTERSNRVEKDVEPN